MANQEQLDILKQGVEVWNNWRKEHPEIRPNLSEADLRETDLGGADLSNTYLSGCILINANLKDTNFVEAILNSANFQGANLEGADLSAARLGFADFYRANLMRAKLLYAYLEGAILIKTILIRTDLEGAILENAELSEAYFYYANLEGANLSAARMTNTTLLGSNLNKTDLSGADLSGSNLIKATLIGTDLSGANLNDCRIYGISAWDMHLDGARQDNLIITLPDQPTITVDNLEVAQFIYLLLNNKKIREVIDTITSKVVLILGRFTPERKKVLDTLRDELRKHNYMPILFDFEKPASRDITETVSTLAHLARFVIADITDAKSIPQELMTIVPNLPSVPIQPLILNSQHEYGMFEHFTRYSWVLPVYRYSDEASLLEALQEKVIAPAEQKAKELNQS